MFGAICLQDFNFGLIIQSMPQLLCYCLTPHIYSTYIIEPIKGLNINTKY